MASQQPSRRQLLNGAALFWVISIVIALPTIVVSILPSQETTGTPAAPVYSERSSWAAHPLDNDDGADILPAWCGDDKQATAKVDVFFVTPSSPIGVQDNNRLDDFFTGLLQWSSLVQQATAFNGIGKVYAPKYRSASQVVQDLDVKFNWRGASVEVPRTDAAMKLAYDDVERAFEEVIVPSQRPFILASHSQGTMHLKRLVGRYAQAKPHVLDRLVVAYLIGNTIEPHEVSPLPVCSHPAETRCVVSYNTVLEGGSAGAFWRNKTVAGAHSRPICVNPLTWTAGDDAVAAPRALHTGGVPLLAHLFLPSLDVGLVSARCDEGILYVSAIPAERASGYPADIDGGPLGCCGRMHAQDIPLFWRNVRTNAAARVEAFLNVSSPAEECRPCGANGGRCIGGLAWHAIVFTLCLYAFFVVLCFPLACPCVLAGLCSGKQRERPELWRVVLVSCCCPCYVCVQGVDKRRRSRRTQRSTGKHDHEGSLAASVGRDLTLAASHHQQAA